MTREQKRFQGAKQWAQFENHEFWTTQKFQLGWESALYTDCPPYHKDTIPVKIGDSIAGAGL